MKLYEYIDQAITNYGNTEVYIDHDETFTDALVDIIDVIKHLPIGEIELKVEEDDDDDDYIGDEW